MKGMIYMKEVIIVGGGISGLTCGLYLARNNFRVKIFNGYSSGALSYTPKIENFPGFPNGISGNELLANIQQQAVNFGCEVICFKVEKIDFEKQKLYTDIEETYHYDVLVLATGTTYKKLSNSDFSNVHYCAMCDGLFYKNKEVTVVGGGDTALTEAIYLSNICKKVYLIHRRNEFRGTDILVKRIKETDNITCLMNNEIIGFEGDQEFTELKLKDRKLKVDGLFVAIGVERNLSLIDREVKFEDNMIIGLDNVFCCGDIVNKYRQAIISSGDGAKTALDIISVYI